MLFFQLAQARGQFLREFKPLSVFRLQNGVCVMQFAVRLLDFDMRHLQFFRVGLQSERFFPQLQMFLFQHDFAEVVAIFGLIQTVENRRRHALARHVAAGVAIQKIGVLFLPHRLVNRLQLALPQQPRLVIRAEALKRPRIQPRFPIFFQRALNRFERAALREQAALAIPRLHCGAAPLDVIFQFFNRNILIIRACAAVAPFFAIQAVHQQRLKTLFNQLLETL